MTCRLCWQSLPGYAWRSARRRGPHVPRFSKYSGTHKVNNYGNKGWGGAFWRRPCLLQHLGGRVKNHRQERGVGAVQFHHRKSSSMSWHLSLYGHLLVSCLRAGNVSEVLPTCWWWQTLGKFLEGVPHASGSITAAVRGRWLRSCESADST